MRLAVRSAVAIAVAVAVALAGYAHRDVARADAATSLGPGLVTVTVDIHYSKFSISTLHVRAGTTVRFLVDNNDPIHHEFIVGDASVHRRHELGKDKTHPPIPGEVSIPPEQVGETFYTFATPGRFLFACHLPGHFAYGMHGWVVVDPA
jgi:uncharacterized cupredoxin-like copper-binding protein